jgi:hypothetical protein
MERLIPKPFPHHRERGLGSVWSKGLVPSLLSLGIPFPQPHTWGKARFGEITKPFHMETKRGQWRMNPPTLASFSNQLTKAKKKLLIRLLDSQSHFLIHFKVD